MKLRRKLLLVLAAALVVSNQLPFVQSALADTTVSDDNHYTIQVNADGGSIGVFTVTDGAPGSAANVLIADDASTTIYSTVFAVNGTTTLGSTLSVAGTSTMNGINNGNDGITNAGAISGATTLTASTNVNTPLVTNISNLTLEADSDSTHAGDEHITLEVSGVDAVTVNSSTTTVNNNMVTNGINNGSDGITNAGAISGATTVNASGTITGGDLSTGGTLGVTGATTLTGLLTANGGITADGGAFTVADTTGNVATTGTLTAGGLTTLNGGITADGGVFTVADTTGNVATSGTLSVTGASTMTGLLTANGGITADGGVFTVADTTGNVATTGTLTASGLTTLNGGITADGGAFTVADTTGNVATSGTLSVNGATTLNNTLAVTGTSTLTGSLTANGGETINNGSAIYSGSGAGNQMVVDSTSTRMISANGTQHVAVSNSGTTITAATGHTVSVTSETTTINGSATIYSGNGANNSIAVTGTTNSNSLIVGDTQEGTVGINTFSYGTHVDGGMLIDGDLGVNGNIYALNDTANATVNVGNNGMTITGAENTVLLQADDDELSTNARAQLAMSPTSAQLFVNTDDGVAHGLTIGQTSTVLSGGTNSTSLTLNDDGARFTNDDTGGPAKVTGVANGTSKYDAVNMGQYRKLENKVDEAYSGIASVAAIAAIPSPAEGKTFSVGIGYGNFKSQNAIAVGSKALVGNEKNITLSAGVGLCDNTTAISGGIGWSF